MGSAVPGRRALPRRCLPLSRPGCAAQRARTDRPLPRRCVIDRPVDMLVQEVVALDDEIDGAPFRIRIVRERRGADIAVEVDEVPLPQVARELSTQGILETDDRVPDRMRRRARPVTPGGQFMEDGEDERLFVGLDRTDPHDGVPGEGSAHLRHQGDGPRRP